MDTLPACCICHRDKRDDELAQRVCHLCARRIDENLLAFAGPRGLYARLNGHMMPGAGGGGPLVSGSRTPGIPPRMEVLNLTARGGIVSVLQTWVEDWASYGHAALDARGSFQRQVDEAVRTLRFNLDWAVRLHDAIDDFAREIWEARLDCERIIDNEPAPHQLTAPCPCGNVIRYDLDTRRQHCRGCHAEYTRLELFGLTRAARSVAA